MEKRELKATFDNIIVKPIEKSEQQYGNLVVPDLGHDKSLKGIVVSAGLGRWEFGQWIATSIVVGQEVYLPPMGPIKIEFEGEEYWVCGERQVLAIIN